MRWLWSAVGLSLFLFAWEGLARSGLLAAHLLPAPSSVPRALYSEWTNDIWLQMLWGSFSHYSVGLTIGSTLGVLVGIVIAMSPRIEALQNWAMRLLRPIPPLAWAPFAIIWFGVTETAAAFIISIGVFWINYFSAFTAVRSVDKDLIEVAHAFGHGNLFARLRKVILPAAMPGILSGLRTGLGQGWMTVVAAELLGVSGIGQRMTEAAGLLASDVVVLYMLTIGALYALTDALFVAVQNRLLAWQK